MTQGTRFHSETIGALLARVRAERGVSQLRLAERLCATAGVATVTRHEVSRWEREERIPSRYWLVWLAVVLDLPIGRLQRAVAVARWRRELSRSAKAHWYEQSPGVYARMAA